MKPLIFDCVQYFMEKEILLARMETLDSIVDYYVVVEANTTHSGANKGWNLEENIDMFSKFLHKIIYCKITDMVGRVETIEQKLADGVSDPILKKCYERVLSGDWWPMRAGIQGLTQHQVDAYCRDTEQKEYILRALTECKDDDILILSDCDEIPDPDKLREVIANFDPSLTYNLRMKNYIFAYNLRNGELWNGSFILTYKRFRDEIGFCELKMKRQGVFIEGAGHHFSFMGNYDKIVEKIKAYGEQSINIPQITGNIQNVVNWCILNGRNLYGTHTGIWEEPVTYETHPKFIVDHPELYNQIKMPK